MYYLPSLKHKLSYLLLGQQGWENRIKIIDLLKERPYNPNQIANKLNISYRTVKHHIDVLLDHDLITSSGSGGYGDVYFLSSELENNFDLFEDIKRKLLTITSSPELYKKVLKQTNDGVIIVDGKRDVIFANKSAEEITGFTSKNLLGGKITFFSEEDFLGNCIDKLSEDRVISGVEAEAIKKSGEDIYLRVTIDRIENDGLLGYSIVFSDITKHKLAERRIKESEERYRRLFETAQDGMLILNTETGKIKDANPFIQDLIGYSKEELVGKKLWDIGTFKNIVENRNRFEELVDEGYIRYEDMPLETKSGKEAPVEFVSNTYEAGGEKVVQCNIRDIQKRKKSEEREEFLYSLLRHDVRNKVNIIDGYLELFEETDISEDQLEYLNKAEDTTEKALYLIQKVRKLNMLTEKDLELYEVNLSSVINNVFSEYESQLKEKDIKTELKLCDCRVKANSFLDDLFFNLLEYSIKHSDCDKIRVDCKNEEECMIIFEDDGRGIPDSVKGDIFQRGFKEGEEAGSGLGLYLVKEIVDIYGGQIEVMDSELGGARFVIRLDMA